MHARRRARAAAGQKRERERGGKNRDAPHGPKRRKPPLGLPGDKEEEAAGEGDRADENRRQRHAARAEAPAGRLRGFFALRLFHRRLGVAVVMAFENLDDMVRERRLDDIAHLCRRRREDKVLQRLDQVAVRLELAPVAVFHA